MRGDHEGDFLQKIFHAGGIMEQPRQLTDVTYKFGVVSFHRGILLPEYRNGKENREAGQSRSDRWRSTWLRAQKK